MYTCLANASKQEVLSSLEALANNRVLMKAGSSGLAPIIMPVILQHILYGLFSSVNANDLVGGVTIFLIALGYSATAMVACQLPGDHLQFHSAKEVLLPHGFQRYRN